MLSRDGHMGGACDLDYEVRPAIEIAWQTTDTEVSSA